MHIDFAPSSGGTYNNVGSSRQLIAYCEHEDLERIEKGIYTDGFFNLTEDNIYKSKVIKDIDTNIGQLLKTDATFFAIHVSPSEDELRAMGNTEQEKAEAMKRYIREVFILEYAKNFNKGLSASDIKFYGKIHFDRNRSDNELNMHCHLIVSRKDQAGKKKLSPLTNHKNTKNGVITGGFDRVNLFQQAEQGFDKLFEYDRQQSESFDYHNTMKNGYISEQLELQNQDFTGEKKKEVFQSSEKGKMISCNLENKEIINQTYKVGTYISPKQENINSNSQTSDSFMSFLPSGINFPFKLEEQIPKLPKKKRRVRRG
ncbi:MAG TPA: clindamycin resistance transfer factor BtgB [Parabacteroides distasonis]|nr:clindamycin resistance transfer factor BtgB [Parabacteroides distasonis]HCX37982.1 clindamycin resistance transfer factor BtgB [Parabacteroides distasonis]